MVVSMFVRQQATPSVKTQNHDDLVALKELVEAGKVTPVIDGTYPLSETPRGDRPCRDRHARGTVVISIASEAATAVTSPLPRPSPANAHAARSSREGARHELLRELSRRRSCGRP